MLLNQEISFIKFTIKFSKELSVLNSSKKKFSVVNALSVMFFEKTVIFVLALICPSNISMGYPPYYVIKVWKHFLLFEQLGTCPIYSYTKNLHGKKYILSKKENGSEDEKTLEWIISRLGENILPNLIGEICKLSLDFGVHYLMV